MEFRLDDFKMFISILWYDNVYDYEILKLNFFLYIEDLFGLNVFLIIWQT
jgi:hypothetical protein